MEIDRAGLWAGYAGYSRGTSSSSSNSTARIYSGRVQPGGSNNASRNGSGLISSSSSKRVRC